MSILVQCPICKKKQSPRNKECNCGQNMDSAKKSKKAIYYITYRLPGGKQRREKIGSSYKEAVAADGKRKSQVAENKILDITKNTKLTFNELAEWFKEQPTKKKLTYFPVLMINITSFNKVYGDCPIYSISTLDLKNYQVLRKAQEMSDSYVDQEIGAVKNMLNTAWEGEMISGDALNPFKKVKKLLKKKGNARDIVLDFKDFLNILKFLPAYARNIISAAFYTGMRRGEIMALTWDRVDLKKRRIELRVEDTKTDEKRYVPISKSLYKILQSIPRSENTNHVFLYRGHPLKDIRGSLKSACKKAGVPYGRKVKGGITFHDLRHTFNTNMRKAGTHDTITMNITGHATREMFDRYNTVDESEKVAAIDAMEKILFDL